MTGPLVTSSIPAAAAPAPGTWPCARGVTPDGSGLVERRLAGRALAAWRQGGTLDGFGDHALLVADPAGAMRLERVGRALAPLGLQAGDTLDARPGLAAELRAACHLVTLRPEPLPFEAMVRTADGTGLLVRGVALPLAGGADPVARVEIVASWRQLLDRSAGRRLKRELVAALTEFRAISRDFSPGTDPFGR